MPVSERAWGMLPHVTGTCEHAAILTGARSRRSALRSRAIHDAYLDPHADELLSQILDESDDPVYAKPTTAAHLGDFAGPHGDAALRRAIGLTGPGSRDVRCAALLALAKRVGPLATPHLVEGLRASDAVVKDYAVIGLAGVGADVRSAAVSVKDFKGQRSEMWRSDGRRVRAIHPSSAGCTRLCMWSACNGPRVPVAPPSC